MDVWELPLFLNDGIISAFGTEVTDNVNIRRFYELVVIILKPTPMRIPQEMATLYRVGLST